MYSPESIDVDRIYRHFATVLADPNLFHFDARIQLLIQRNPRQKDLLPPKYKHVLKETIINAKYHQVSIFYEATRIYALQ